MVADYRIGALIRVGIMLFLSFMIALTVLVIGIIMGVRSSGILLLALERELTLELSSAQLTLYYNFMAVWMFMTLIEMTFMSIILFLIRGLGPLGLLSLTYDRQPPASTRIARHLTRSLAAIRVA